MLREDVAKKLDDIRKKFNCSYSEAVEILTKRFSLREWEIEKINEHFEALERETSIKSEVLEYMRVIAIQFAKGKNGAAVRLLRELAQQREGDEK
jgi:predicted nuclease with TOPRIM domain